MTQRIIQKCFAPLKATLPKPISRLIRRVVTAFVTPYLHAYQSGFIHSSLKMKAVTSKGNAIPWYTYSSIDFLRFRSFEDKSVLEFGAGQSTLWWSSRAKSVTSFEGDKEWFEMLKPTIAPNVDLHLADMTDAERCVHGVRSILNKKSAKYDVIIVDGLFRSELVPIAVEFLAASGVIICDNSEGYNFQSAFLNLGFERVDFFGPAPGVVLPHCTSIFFRSGAFLFSPKYPIPVLAHNAI